MWVDCHEKEIKDWVPESREQVLSCSCCRVTFPSIQQQREHYKLDWHRYNLKQSLLSKVPIGEEEFNSKTENGTYGLEKNFLQLFTFQMKCQVYPAQFQKMTSKTLQIHSQHLKGRFSCRIAADKCFPWIERCYLWTKKWKATKNLNAIVRKFYFQEDASTVSFYQRYKDTCWDNQQWAIIMLGGGHFAAAIFNGLSPILHKTFHCYTVRSGQGGTQSGKDGKSGGSHPKSAGASLRRYNEQALNDVSIFT